MAANEAYERWRATARDTKGRVLKGNSKPLPAGDAGGMINLSDPDSRVMRTQGTPPRQAYNAQAAVNDQQIMLAAEISVAAPDFGHLAPMLETTLAAAREHGVASRPEVVLGDAGYWHTAQMQAIEERGSRCSPARTGTCATGKRPGWEHGRYRAYAPKAVERPRP